MFGEALGGNGVGMQQCCPNVVGGSSPLAGEELWPSRTYALRQVSVPLLRFCWQEGPARLWRSPTRAAGTPTTAKIRTAAAVAKARAAVRTGATTTSTAASAAARIPTATTVRRAEWDRVARRARRLSVPAPITALT